MNYRFHLIYGVIMAALAIGLVFSLRRAQVKLPPVEKQPSNQEIHWHADLRVVVDGQQYDFSRYDESVTHNTAVHFHKPDFDVLHIHKSGTTWEDFFRSVGGKIEENCLTLPGSSMSCSNLGQQGSPVLKTFVNGSRVNNLDKQDILDLEKVIIYFGSDLPDQTILASPIYQVSSKACAYDKLCQAPPGLNVDESQCTADKPCKQ